MQTLHMLLHFDRYLGAFIAQYGTLIYALLFLIIFCEMALLPLFFLPGDPLLFICGAFSATGALNLWVVMVLLFVAAISGSLVNYRIGRAVGQQVFVRNYRWLDQDALRKTHAFYENRGSFTFLVSPFIAVVRTFAPFVAGVSAMTLPRFLLSMGTGTALWVATLVAGGYFFGNIPQVHEHLEAIVLVGIGLGVGSLVVAWAWKSYLKHRA